ncbi:MAG: PH domain-containing protein [Nocardioides sp.]
MTDLPPRPEQPGEPAPEAELARDDHWQRLDPRMLLVHPVRELLRFLPVLVGVFLAGSATGGGGPWHLVGVGIPVGLGLLRYLTTSFRIVGGRVELRRGLLNRHVLSAPLDRVRTVDLTSSPIHRLLGLTTVRIGTGTSSTDDEDRLDLDGLPLARARRLREELLRVTPAAGGSRDVPPAGAGRVVLTLDPSWLRFAPFTSAGLVITGAVLGAGSQLVNALGGWDHVDLRLLADGTAALSWWTVVPLAALALVLLVSLLSVGGYVVSYWGFTLTHDQGAWHLRRGLLTTRETSLDDARVSGVSVCEPLGLRLVGGGRVAAIVTGLDKKQQGSAVLVPPAPRAAVLGVARQVLGVASPVDVPLTGHGRRARTRRYTRALVPSFAVVALVAALVAALDAPWWPVAVALVLPVLAVPLAADRAAGLGHALVDGYVVSQSGSLDRHRRALATEDVIGWNFRSTWFQRRAGLTSLVATTAGGEQAVELLDVPEDAAEALAAEALPELLAAFRG